MLFLGWMAAIGSGWFLCLAAPRFDSRIHGSRGFALGAALLVIAAFLLVRSGLGLAEAIASVLGLVTLAIPCVSWSQAARKRAAKAKGRA